VFSKILIANRGEIACRIIRTARKMGIATVAVHSDADARAPFVRLADEAMHIGPSPAAQSYLVADKIIAAAKQTGAEAVHPGYGFLSERTSFAEALAAENIAFIGPPVNAIAAMGDKIESKKLAKEAGVNVVPGYLGEIDDTEHAIRISSEIGYPVMMKASAGGGGKGMRLAFSEKDVREGFEATKREGLNSFGDDRVFIEKFILNPRHIEIQVLGDQHGNIVYLNERECSIQRRHQKVVEEAPSPFVTPKMIRVAAGEKLGFTQANIGINGWAIENRVYAEDPYRGFLPSTGRLVRYNPPAATLRQAPFASAEPPAVDMEGHAAPSSAAQIAPANGDGEGEGSAYIRIDDGVAEGGEVSMFYDPMIAKLITWGPTRDAAADLQVKAIDSFEIAGLGHNLDFLSAIMQHPRFRSGELTTGFIAEEYPEGFVGAPASPELQKALAGIAAHVGHARANRALRVSGQLGKPLSAPAGWRVILGGNPFSVQVAGDTVNVDGEPLRLRIDYAPGWRMIDARVNDQPLSLRIEPWRSGFKLTTGGAVHQAHLIPERLTGLAQLMKVKTPPDMSKFLVCPMPGLLVALHVKEGDPVEAGQPLAVVEAMKMENILRAEKAGKVKTVNAEAGASLAVDAIILEME
jgi:propionyl-CoA carboxylase alpha chain